MTLPRISYEARCPDCGRRAVVPSHQIGQASEDWTFPCCTGLVTAPIVAVEKPKPKKKASRSTLRRRSPKRTDLARRLADRWAKSSRDLSCAACGAITDWKRGIVVQGHHIVRQALIRARGREEDWSQEELDRRLWDLRNRLPLCAACHAAHHSAMQRLSWNLVIHVATKVEQFAREVGLMSRARREYA